ncbi:hypothetical protein [Streptococcus oriscaviae]|uniref:Lipoprotein n=1 Tax=Streptococcus oriscaviae TaxID=2781599 RepID=A0ABX7YM76_9STRE|nr:hypothetical protein [Streptococcus oriscaviae]QUE54925.1 hypothetical protein INT76_03315 [Streptococcus oriscaviae]
MKRFLYALVAFLSVTLLASCSSTFSQQSNQEKQTITVYDENDEKILETTDTAVLEKFSDYASQNTVEGLEVFDAVPNDAQLAYRFILKGQSKYEITMEIYQNYDLLSIKDLPILGDLQLKLTKEEAEWFRTPEKWE